MEKPSYLGHRERIKKKFKTEGLSSFLDHEILELLLTFSIFRKDTKKLAWTLVNTFGSLDGVLEANSSELCKIKGLGPQSALLINLINAVMKRYNSGCLKQRQSILNQEELYNYITANLKDKKQECFEVLFLNIKLKLIAAEVLVQGDNIGKNSIPLNKIVELIIRHGAKSIICIHHKPCNEPDQAQEEEAEITKYLQTALTTLSVTIADYIIVGKGKLYSLRSKNFLRSPKVLL